MSDDTLRTAERCAAAEPHDQDAQVTLWRERDRAGIEVPVPWLVEVPCPGDGLTTLPCKSDGPYHDCCRCKGAGVVPQCHQPRWPNAPVRDVLRLRAYAGDSVARATGVAAPKRSRLNRLSVEKLEYLPYVPTWEQIDALLLATWTTGLTRLAAALPRIVVAGACSQCHGSGWDGAPSDPLAECTVCQGTGQHTTPAEQWLSVVAAVAVGQAARNHLLLTWDGSEPNGIVESGRALEAAEAWTRCPCPSRAVALGIACSGAQPDWCRFAGVRISPESWLPRLLAGAAEYLTPEVVRAAACAAMLSVMPL